MKQQTCKDGVIEVFGFLFDATNRTLKRDGKIIQLRKKQSEVLKLLCLSYPDTVHYEELFETVWKGRCVTKQSIAQVVRSLRIILQDGNKNSIITVPKLGYRLGESPGLRFVDKKGEGEIIKALNGANSRTEEALCYFAEATPVTQKNVVTGYGVLKKNKPFLMIASMILFVLASLLIKMIG